MSLRVVFMGTPDFAVPTLKALIEAGHQVVGVFTQPDRPKGRGGKLQQSPVKVYASACGIPVYQPMRIRADGLEELRKLVPEVCVTAAYGQILSQEVLDIPRLGTINVHASLLPRHRGPAPVQWAILQGDEETGVTTMLTDRGIDTGNMLLRETCFIGEEDTAGTLLEKLSHLGAALLIKALNAWAVEGCISTPQDENNATYDPMLTKEMGFLKFEEGTEKCLRRVRAMNPWPCAYTPLAEGVLKVWKARRATQTVEVPLGTVLAADSKQGLVIATADGAMELQEIQMPGAKRMDARAFLRGHDIQVGILLREVKI